MSGSVVVPMRPKDARTGYPAWIQGLVPEAFRSDRVPLDPLGVYSIRPCLISHCERPTRCISSELCRLHDSEWSESGDLIKAFVARISEAGEPAKSIGRGRVVRGYFDFGAVQSPVLRAELAYGLSRRVDPENGYAPVRLWAFERLVRVLNTTSAVSVLDLASDELLTIAQQCGGYSASAAALMTQAVTEIRLARGDEGVVRRIGTRRGGSSRYSAGQRIAQPWLRHLVRDWVDYRLATEAASADHIGQQEAMLVAFAAWCESQAVESPAHFTRPLLLAWLRHVNTKKRPGTQKPLSAGYRRKHFRACDELTQFVSGVSDAVGLSV